MAQGNIRERSPGSFEVRVYAGSRGGKRFYITRTVRGTRKDAEAVLTRIQHEYNSGLVSAPSRGTVAEFLAEWLESADLAASTLVTTRGIVNRHLVPLLGDIRLTTLRVSDIDKAWAKLRRQGYKGSTIRRVHGVLHRALGVAVRWDRIASNCWRPDWMNMFWRDCSGSVRRDMGGWSDAAASVSNISMLETDAVGVVMLVISRG